MVKGAVAFIRKDNLFLFVLRDDKDWIVDPNRWSIVGGHVEVGESFEQGILREIKEETGIVPVSCELLCEHDVKIVKCGEPYCVKEAVFFAMSNSDVGELTEGQCYEWLSLEDALERNIPPRFKEYIEKYREKLTE